MVGGSLLLPFSLLAIIVHCSANFPVPPSIVEHPQSQVIVDNPDIKLRCIVEGSPMPDVTWYHNDNEVYYSGVIQMNFVDGDATLSIDSATIINKGYYQCVAQNQYGKSLSNVAFIDFAVLGSFPTTNPKIVHTGAGEPQRLECQPPKSIPHGTISWNLRDPKNTDSVLPLTMDKRIQMDQDGNLLFSNVATTDYQQGRQYVCRISNPVTLTSNGGSLHVLYVKGNTGNKESRKPTIMYSTPGPVIGLTKQSVELQCFFSGYSTPTVSWRRKGGNMPPGYVRKEHQTRLVLNNLKFGDEGVYTCSAYNMAGGSTFTEIEVKVEEAPYFSAAPKDMYGTVGSEVAIHCHANGKPAPKVKWYINGDIVDTHNPPVRMLFDNGDTTLFIRKLCKDCRDPPGQRTSDLMVIQCNASNTHGFVYGQGFLNVINRTELTVTPPEQMTVSLTEHQLILPCEATSDLSTPWNITWYKGDSTVTSLNDDRLTVTGDNDSLLIDLTDLDITEKSLYDDLYRCVATNGYSDDEATCRVAVEGAVQPLVESASTPWWIIVVVVAILLLLLIIILCCCLCAKRNKGDDYDVDKLERKSGIYPEKENRENDFKAYERPDAEPPTASRVSLTSTVQLDSDDDGMADEYGDPDGGKFEDDGTFIGQYDTYKAKQSLV